MTINPPEKPGRPACMSSGTLRIATRRSPLALWQAEHVASRLRSVHPDLTVELVPMTTRGDQLLNQPLASMGGKGLFVKTLEKAILDNRADIAVHSLKDVPMTLTADFTLAAILPRADVADAFVSNDYASIAALPHGARVGSCSLRRRAQLRALRGDLELLDLRGNVDSRLTQLDRGHYEAIIVASAGLTRLGLNTRIRSRLSTPDWLPAPGQAALAIEARQGNSELLKHLIPLDDAVTRTAVTAERAMSRHLGGSCHAAIGAWCAVSKHRLHLLGMVGDASTGRLLLTSAGATHTHPEALGQQVAERLLEQGARPVMGD